MNITPEILKTFCGGNRIGTQEPYSQKGYTWATDGRIMLRVPFIESVPENKDAPKNTDVVFSCFNPNECRNALQSYPTVQTVTCPDCDGEGTDEYGCICGYCDGDPTWEKGEGVNCGTRKLSNIYLDKLSKLSGVLISMEGAPLTPCSFVFDGGCGLLMPMRVVEEVMQ